MPESNYFSEKSLIQPAIKRAAYSDRTAWLMAEMSRLAYERFEDSPSVQDLAKELVEIRDVEEVTKKMQEYLDKLAVTNQGDLATELRKADFTLLNVYDVDNTQAFLAKLSKSSFADEMLVLVFRGTEANYADIKTDLEGVRVDDGHGNRVHQGFLQAFRSVEQDIIVDLAAHPGLPLYITGHSLGGALAVMATKYLANDSTGACYTFGGPRVGGKNFRNGVKTPVYRVVNAADGVPRVPPSWGIDVLIFISHFIPYLGKILESFLQKFQGYVHLGDMRYLTHIGIARVNGKVAFPGLQLISNPSLPERVRRFIVRFLSNWKAPAQDHSILLYSQKLRYYAVKNNPQSTIGPTGGSGGSTENIEVKTNPMPSELVDEVNS